MIPYGLLDLKAKVVLLVDSKINCKDFKFLLDIVSQDAITFSFLPIGDALLLMVNGEVVLAKNINKIIFTSISRSYSRRSLCCIA